MLDVHEGKTPELYQKVVERLGVKPEEVIGVGDLLHREIKALNILGSKTIWIQNKWSRKVSEFKESEKPDYIVSDLFQTKEIIKELVD